MYVGVRASERERDSGLYQGCGHNDLCRVSTGNKRESKVGKYSL